MTKRRFRESRQSRAKIMEGNHQVAAAEAVKDSRKQPTRSREGRERDGKGRDILKKLLSLNPLLDSLNSSTTSPPKELLRPRPPIKHSEAPKRPRKRIPSATLNNKVSEFDAAESTISICRICGSAIDHEYKQNCGIESVANSLQATPNIACDWPPLLNSTTDANHTYYRSAAAAQGEMFAHEILENLLDQSHTPPRTFLSNDYKYMILDQNNAEYLSHLHLNPLEAIDSQTFGSNSSQSNADMRAFTDCANLKSSDNYCESCQFRDSPFNPSYPAHNASYHKISCLDNLISYIRNASLQFDNLHVIPVTYQVRQDKSRHLHTTTTDAFAAHRRREALSSSTFGIDEDCDESDDIMSPLHPASMDYFKEHKRPMSDYVKEFKQNAKHLPKIDKNNKIENKTKENNDNDNKIDNKKEILSTIVCDNYSVQKISLDEDQLDDSCGKILASDTTNSSSITDYLDQHDRLADSLEISGRKSNTSKHSADSTHDYREEIGEKSDEDENFPKLSCSSSKLCNFSSLNPKQSLSPKSTEITRMSPNDPGSADNVPSARKKNQLRPKSKVKDTKQSVFNISGSYEPQSDYQDADRSCRTHRLMHDSDHIQSRSSTPLPTPSVYVYYNVYFCIPKRIFVGGISRNTRDQSLLNLFSDFGQVVEVNLMRDSRGMHRGFGFITFDKQETADQLLHEYCDIFVLDNRKLNIGPAIRRLPFSIDPSTLLELIKIFRQ